MESEKVLLKYRRTNNKRQRSKDILSSGLSSAAGEHNSRVRPVLRGTIGFTNGKLVWSGCWALTNTKFNDVFPDSAQKAPFCFQREVESSASQNIMEIVNDGKFDGYFCTILPVFSHEVDPDSKQKSSFKYQKHLENGLRLKFGLKYCEKSKTKVYEVLGSGENKFGQFLVEGIYDPVSKELNCQRNYLPSTKKASPKKKSKKIRFSNIAEKEEKSDEEIIADLVGDIFDLGGDVDPLSKNPAALCSEDKNLTNIPLTKTNSAIFDLSTAFDPEHTAFFKLSGEMMQNKLFADIGFEDEASDEVSINFDDLKDLDADTIKELNQIGEFACPSKGA